MKIDNRTLKVLKENRVIRKELAYSLGVYLQVVNRWAKTGRINPLYKKAVEEFVEKRLDF